MSKKSLQSPAEATLAPVQVPVIKDMPSPPPPTPERLQEVDRLALELSKSKRQTALAEAKAAVTSNELSELSYRHIVLQLYMKYGLNEKDAISETGEILRGGAVQQ